MEMEVKPTKNEWRCVLPIRGTGPSRGRLKAKGSMAWIFCRFLLCFLLTLHEGDWWRFLLRHTQRQTCIHRTSLLWIPPAWNGFCRMRIVYLPVFRWFLMASAAWQIKVDYNKDVKPLLRERCLSCTAEETKRKSTTR